MKAFNKSIAMAALSCGLMLGSTVPVMAASAYQDYGRGYGRDYEYSGLRRLVARTQQDIQAASEAATNINGDQRERYRDAQKHISDFDRHLSKGHYDKDEIDHVIADVQGILDHNTLMAHDRDALQQDVTQLREARARHNSH
jgi:hypothetical protein